MEQGKSPWTTYCFFFLFAASCALVTASFDDVTPIFEAELSEIFAEPSGFAFAASGSLVALESGPHAQSAMHEASTVTAREFFMTFKVRIRLRGVKCCRSVTESMEERKTLPT